MRTELFLDSLSYLSFTVVLLVLAYFSRRLGEAMRLRSYYYLYYLSILFTVAAAGVIWSSFFRSGWDTQLISYILFSTGMTLGVVATVKYWGWILPEMRGGR